MENKTEFTPKETLNSAMVATILVSLFLGMLPVGILMCVIGYIVLSPMTRPVVVVTVAEIEPVEEIKKDEEVTNE